MVTARTLPWTVDDVLAFEANEPERYELVGGIVRMMTGASAAHSAIKPNIAIALRTALGSGRCRVDVDDLKRRSRWRRSTATAAAECPCA